MKKSTVGSLRFTHFEVYNNLFVAVMLCYVAVSIDYLFFYGCSLLEKMLWLRRIKSLWILQSF